MAHLDFEMYAIQRHMGVNVAERYSSFFFDNVYPYINRNYKILDFGCGDGRYFPFFSDIVHIDNIYGVDISQTRIDRCIDLGFKQVFKIDNPELPFEDSFFDLINFDQVIEHIPTGDVEQYLQELQRVLSKNGLIVLLTPNYPVKRLYDFYYCIRYMDMNRFYDDPTHIARYSFKSLRNLLSQYFDIMKIEPTGGRLWDIIGRNEFSAKIICLLKKKA